ncbi:MAG: peroxiredoxin [Candidatus Eisenbacteria bacterium]
MARSDDLHSLPEDLPVPQDDGACAHLLGARWARVSLMSSQGRLVDLAAIAGRVVVYAYPRTGVPDRDPPAGWDLIPGARGCTPQSCAYRDQHAELRALGALVFGLATNPPAYQHEAAERLHLPFELLSDEAFALTQAMHLPTFEVGGMRLLRRFTLIARDGVIERVHYPVFPTNADAGRVLEYLGAR